MEVKPPEPAAMCVAIVGVMRSFDVGAATMEDISILLARWQITSANAREQVYRAKTPRERERWHALWLLSRGWSAAQVGGVISHPGACCSSLAALPCSVSWTWAISTRNSPGVPTW